MPDRRWLDKSWRDALQMLTSEAAALEGNWDAVQLALRSVCARWPHSVTAWNAYSRRALMQRAAPQPCPDLDTQLDSRHNTDPDSPVTL